MYKHKYNMNVLERYKRSSVARWEL